MKSSKLFNNISDKLKAEIPKLKPGERVVFQMLNGVPNPEPDEKERAKSPMLYGKVQIPTNFRIYDPYQKNEAGDEIGGYVDVGCVDIWNGDRPEKFRFFVPGQSEYAQFQGKFELVGGKVQDEELYETLWLSNYREGNKHRDESVEVLFKIVNLKEDSKKSVSKVDQLREALNIVKEATPEQMKKVMAALGQPTYQDPEVLKAKFGELAKDNYEVFLNTWKDPKTETKFLLKTALESGIIAHDFPTGKITMGKVELGTLQIEGTSVLVDELTNWLTTSEKGGDILKNIEAQTKNKTEPVK